MEMEKFNYDNSIVRMFFIATVVWSITAFTVGLTIALELPWPALNLGISWMTFGRIRPLHTNAAIFAFVGNAIFMGYYYAIQRLLKARNFNDTLSKIHFWGWNLIIVAAVITLPLGITTSKEYAELEWPIDIAITLIWVVWGINMIGTIMKRREKHLYVAIWFFIATFFTIAVLHIGNSMEIPITLTKSYSLYAGVQDALIQWWYGHNAVAFFLTTPFLGLMYYFMPKAAQRPVYSYRLSIVHFWALIFIYIWAGPHHLLYTSTPDWAQTLGTVFSVVLIAPSWGGMLNGLLTLRGAWDRVRQDPVLKFMVVAITAYGMSTFEGPMLSLKNVNALSHFTDWTIAHVHVGALGWNGFFTFGMIYWLVPRLYGTKLYSVKWANWHFWIGTLGILFWVIPMYWAGITQGLMWKQFTPEGNIMYPNFLETVTQIIPMYWMRAFGGTLYLSGAILMAVNVFKTTKQGTFIPEEAAEAAPLVLNREAETTTGYKHRWIESRPIQFFILSTVVILIGGLVEAIPLFVVKSNIPTIESVKPYTALQLTGRDIYIREGCYNCHSQMIRPFRDEVARYGEYSKAGEFVYDHPFLWGSKRTGPDLLREGAAGPLKKPDAWHFSHMRDPRTMSPGSIMPPYPWLIENETDYSTIGAKISGLRKIGVPYPEGYEDRAMADIKADAQVIVGHLKSSGVQTTWDREIVAVIAYLQGLGAHLDTGK
jgi:cytochrome c oxidase cbb3-type subunit I/II